MVGAFFSYGFGSARTYANNVEQRETKMKFSDIKFNQTKLPKGIQALFNFGDKYELSIVKNTSSYGNANGLYEIAVFQGNEQIELPGVTEEGDTVKGFLTEEDVLGIIKKMQFASGDMSPKQVALAQ